jgi:hypothetical protein
MSVPEPALSLPSATRLAELLVSAAATLDGTSKPGLDLAPTGVPVRSGRVHVARVRHWLPLRGELAVVVGFGNACWLGSPELQPPDLGRQVYRSTARIDGRGRVVLDRRTRAWLAVENAASFQAVTLPLGWACEGLLVVPVEDYARRLEAVTP